MTTPPKRAPSFAPSFKSDVTFSTLTKPFELQLSSLGKTQSSSISTKSATVKPPSSSSPRPPLPIDSRNVIESEHQPDQEESKPNQTLNRFKSVAKSAFLKYWFLLGLAIAILLAWQFPNVGRKGGYIRAEWSIKWGKQVLLYMSIVTYKDISPDLASSSSASINTDHKSHHHSVLCIWACTPVLQSAHAYQFIAADWRCDCCSDSNHTLMNAALGNVLGIFVSPALVSFFQGPLLAASPEDESSNTAGGSVDFIMVLKQLGLTVLLPLVVGQVIQIFFTEPVAKLKVKCRLSDVSSVCLLLMVWSVFSDAVHAGSFSAVAGKDIAVVVVLNFLFYVLFSTLSLVLARLPYPKRMFGTLKWFDRLRYSREDTVAVMFCGATKTVAMGVPLINVLYQKGDPGTIGVLSTPLLLYHVEQLILGNIEVEILKKWVLRGQKRDEQKAQGDAADEGQHTSTTSTATSIHLDRDEEHAYDSANGGPEPMDFIVDQNEFIVETIATHTEYLKTTASSKSSLTCPMLIEKTKDKDIRMKEASMKRDYCMSVSAAARSSWVFTFEQRRDELTSIMCVLDSIFEGCKKVGRKCIFTEEHETAVINFIDANPSATVVEVTEHLSTQFHDLKVSRSTVYNFMRSECNLSLKKADFHPIERNSSAKIEERHDWVCKWENTDMNFLTNCVFLDESAFNINMKHSRASPKKVLVPFLPDPLREL
ncbi:hypothetical protein [Parasitella parasitica]|uniref:Uncharacterized protein n=1 Tax=Parasitella parasitica TaxID=35722 RepID=A0A0B7N6S5_9FUNG|nr:hypothetical protein [Parasitella parasitica]